MSETTVNRGNRKTRVGIVTSDKMDKTIVVTIRSRYKHPLYGKIISHTRKFKAHDEENACGIGDTVRIMEPGRFPATSAGAWLRSSKKRSKTLPWARRAMAQA